MDAPRVKRRLVVIFCLFSCILLRYPTTHEKKRNMESTKRRRTNNKRTNGYVHTNQGIQTDTESLIIRCGERGGLRLSRNGTSFASQDILSEMGDIRPLYLGDKNTEDLLDAVATNLNVIQYRQSDTDPMQYAIVASDLRNIVPSMVEGNGIIYSELFPLLTLLAKRQQTINRSSPMFATGEMPLVEGRVFVDLYGLHGPDLLQTLTNSQFTVTVEHTPPCATMHIQLAVAVDIYQAYDGRVFLAVDTGDTKIRGNIHYSIMVQQGTAPEPVLYSGAGFTGEATPLHTGWNRNLGPRIVGSVYGPFGRSVSL